MEYVIHKYSGTNYFKSTTQYVDKMTFTEIFADGFPLFNYETEDISGIAIYKGGEFDLKLSLLQSNTSITGKSIKDFFMGSNRDYFYLINVFFGSQKFSGVAHGSQISADFTFSQNKNEIRIIFKDILQEWRDINENSSLSSLQINNNDLLTFEEYVIRHFQGLTHDRVLIGTPINKTYLQRLQPYLGPGGLPPISAYFFGDFYNFITNKSNISRWEAWKEFIKGIGCNFKMQVNGSSVGELPNLPEYQFEIFFMEDLESETPATIQIIEHKEFTTAKRFKWLYLKYRSLILSGVDYSNGIVFNTTQSYQSDTDNAANHLYPSLLLTFDNKVLTYDNGVSSEITLIRDSDFIELDLIQYAYGFTPGIGIGKLYPLDEADGGGMAYSQCMMCTVANEPPPTSNIDFYYHIPVNKYAIVNYKRYLNGLQKAKQFKVVFSESTNLKLWKTIKVNDGNGEELYYISAIRDIDLRNETAEIECIKLKSLSTRE